MSLLALFDSRSFSSPWYWLAFAGLWAAVMHNALGVPSDLVVRAARDEDAGPQLLDWLRLVLPRWRIGAGTAAVLTGAGCFLATVLAVLGFGHGFEAARALFLLAVPPMAVVALRLRLARGLAGLLADRPPPEAARIAAQRLLRHGWAVYGMALAAAILASIVAADWLARHPFGP